jgi:hypothetical protein
VYNSGLSSTLPAIPNILVSFDQLFSDVHHKSNIPGKNQQFKVVADRTA